MGDSEIIHYFFSSDQQLYIRIVYIMCDKARTNLSFCFHLDYLQSNLE
jgi:hypothetical protein